LTNDNGRERRKDTPGCVDYGPSIRINSCLLCFAMLSMPFALADIIIGHLSIVDDAALDERRSAFANLNCMTGSLNCMTGSNQ
jgi:hypothetical protein